LAVGNPGVRISSGQPITPVSAFRLAQRAESPVIPQRFERERDSEVPGFVPKFRIEIENLCLFAKKYPFCEVAKRRMFLCRLRGQLGGRHSHNCLSVDKYCGLL
jgi:hypothetical protein